MIKALDYLYYRFFKFGKLLSGGLSRPHYRAAFAADFGFFFYTAAILELMGSGLNPDNILAYLVGFLIVHYLVVKFFLNPRRYRRVMKEYGNESFAKGVLGNMLVAVYMGTSLIALVWVKANLN